MLALALEIVFSPEAFMEYLFLCSPNKPALSDTLQHPGSLNGQNLKMWKRESRKRKVRARMPLTSRAPGIDDKE